MKKLLLAVLTATLTLSLVCFAGCEQSSHTHTSSEWIIDEQPSCGKTGLKHKKCTICNAILQFAQIDALTHEYENYVCKHCKKEYCSDLQYKLLQDKTGYEVVGIEDSTATEIYIPSKYKGLPVTIGENAFCDNEIIEKVYIHNGVTSIGDSAFADCSNLTNITIPNSITFIGWSIFWGCSSLTSITIPNSVISIGGFTFKDCNSLQYNEYDNAYYLGNKDNPYLWLIKAKSTDIKSCNINEKCKFIYYSAFSFCNSLTSITIPDSVTSIGNYAFADCSNLTNIIIPNSVTYIGNSVFAYCSSLTSINVDENNTAYKSINGNLYSKDGKILIQYAIGKNNKSFTITNSVTSIGDSAFRSCSSLKSITIPNSITSIGDSAFDACSRLESITIPDSVTSIGNSAFSFCSSLESITIPDSVTSIGNYAFDCCSSLKSVTIPNSVISIGRDIFFLCDNLTNIYYTGTQEEWDKIEIKNDNGYLTGAKKYFYS